MIYKTSTLLHSANWRTKQKQMSNGELIGFYKKLLDNERIQLNGAAHRRLLILKLRAKLAKKAD